MTERLMIFLPPLCAAVAMLAVSRPWQRAVRPGGAWGGALALGGSYLLAHGILLGVPPWPPVQHRDWFPLLALAGAALGLFDALSPASVKLRWGLRLPVLMAALMLLLRSRFRTAWAGDEGVAWLAGLMLAGWIGWVPLEELAGRAPPLTLPLALTLEAAALSLVTLFSGSLLLFLLAANVAATLLGVLLVAGWRPARSPVRGALPVAVLLLTGVGLSSRFYSDMPVASALLLLTAPAAVWLTARTTAGRLAPRKAVALHALAALVPTALAVAVAYRAAPPGEW